MMFVLCVSDVFMTSSFNKAKLFFCHRVTTHRSRVSKLCFVIPRASQISDKAGSSGGVPVAEPRGIVGAMSPLCSKYCIIYLYFCIDFLIFFIF
jgi:hypothetical protein